MARACYADGVTINDRIVGRLASDVSRDRSDVGRGC